MKGHTELPVKFSITWRDGRYFVSIPNYKGGEVVRADAVTELVEALERLIIGATAEFNEKGAGGYALARLLSDARSALSHYRELAGTSNEVAK